MLKHKEEDINQMKSIASKIYCKYESGGTITATPKGDVSQYIREWNPLLLTIYYGHLHIVKYYCEILRVHMKASLEMSKGGGFGLLFPLAVCLEIPERVTIFNYLWE